MSEPPARFGGCIAGVSNYVPFQGDRDLFIGFGNWERKEE